MIHYSEIHAGNYLGKAVPVLNKAGASHVTYMKPKIEKNMPSWFRVYHWPDESDATAQEVKKCLDSTGISPNGFTVEAANPTFMPAQWRVYSVVVYIVNQ